jgi:hypothetical protein
MALERTIDDNEDLDRQTIDGTPDPLADRSTVPEWPYLTHDEAAALIRGRKDPREFDRWRHLPTLELHYYPRGTEPENPSDYVRFLP